MKNLGSKARALLLAGGCTVAGILAVPAVAVAKDAAQDVFITNTAANAVPVAVQGTTPVTGTVTVNGTTQIAGTVTVANPTPAPEPAPAPVPVQANFAEKPITRALPFATGILYQVPEGKVLVVEFFQAHWLFSGVDLRQADLRVGCQPPGGFNYEGQVFLPDMDAGIGYHAVGGATSLIVPGGRCLTYEVGVDNQDLDATTTLYMYGGFTGHLMDAPAATP